VRKFFLVVGLMWASAYGLHHFVTSGKLLAELDAKPHRRGTASVLFYWAQTSEIFNKHRKALELYQRVYERYPKSRYAEDSFYGIASSYERLRMYPESLAAYKEFLEVYPDSQYSESVANNINILYSR
jgi:tetratricopeptide (TPR) repeat protein